MKTSDFIASTIDRFPKGYVFTYEDFITKVNKKEAVIKALNRMTASGKIEKLSKGKFYKPEKTIFGNLQPDQIQIVKDLLEKDGKLIGYITGYTLYNRLGLTTQVSNTIQIGRNEIRPTLKRGRYTISFILQKNNITKDNIPLLQILDAVRYIKKIPDATVEKSCKRLLVIIKDLSKTELSKMIKLVQNYPPSAKALLGALLDEISTKTITDKLLESLNPITAYNIPGADKVLTNTKKWNIK